MKSILLISISTLMITACARPDYIDPKSVARQDNSGQATACTLYFSSSQNCARIDWSQGPQTPDESEFIVKFWNSTTGNENGPYQDPQQSLSVVLWMPSMGHGSSPVKIEKIQDGIYRVKKVYFIMPGDWEIRFFLKDQTTTPATTVDQATLKLML